MLECPQGWTGSKSSTYNVEKGQKVGEIMSNPKEAKGRIVIDENTIYELDLDCIECKNATMEEESQNKNERDCRK